MKAIAAAALAAAIASSYAQVPPGAVPDYVTFEGGAAMGVRFPDQNLRYFLGIPYAATTAGANAWALPQPRQPWNGTLDATQPGHGCYSMDHNPDTSPDQDFDCLNVNIFAPITAPGTANLPVMVFLYGGAFREGWNWGPFGMYNASFTSSVHDVVVVTINYRLGALGFLVTDTLTGNYGLMDQTAALQWVQRNIGLVGGDSGAVTIFGESAGAMSIGVHLTAPGSAGLFQRAIMESNVGAYNYKNISEAAVYGFQFCGLLNCTTNGGASCDTGCLRAAQPSALVDAWSKSSSNAIDFIIADWGHLLDGFLQYTPVVDGNIVPVEPQEAIASGSYWALDHNVSVLLGTNSNEGETFLYATVTDPLPGFLVDLAYAVVFKPDDVTAINAQPRYNTNVTDGRTPLSNVITDYWFRCGSTQFANAAVARGIPAWVYRFDHLFSGASVFPKFGLPQICAEVVCHAAELPFVFHNDVPSQNATFTPAEVALSSAMVSMWTNFAKTGNPNNGNGTAGFVWPAWDVTNKFTAVLNDTMTVESAASMCALWDSLGYFW